MSFHYISTITQDAVIRLYKKGLSTRKIAALLPIQRQYVCELLKQNNITARQRNGGAPQGEKAPNWQGGICGVSILIRTRKQTRQWKAKILARDGYCCVLCGSKEQLQVDHIVPLKEIKKQYTITEVNDELFIKIPLLTDINNGRTLCFDCHKETETYGNKI